VTPIRRFAHRGASALAPENTLIAFREAVRLGCDWIETDVRLSADGVPVLIHDETVDRTTGGRGSVGSLTLRQLRRLDAGSWFGIRHRGEPIPTLDEALEWCRGRCGLNLEIKEEDRIEELVGELGRRFKGHGGLDRILFSSFRRSDLQRLRAALPAGRLGWLVSRNCRGLKSIHRKIRLAALHPKERLVTRRLVRRCERSGLAVHAWVVNRSRRLTEIEEIGVDGIMTDDPRIFEALTKAS
jgi:glycerophosphoryl diester phosphodiesterase